MKFSEAWLRTWVNPSLSTSELTEKFVTLGMEVAGVAPVAGEFSEVIIGEILTLEKHPNADSLQVCSVSAGQGKMLTIVCGAPNVAVGMKAPLAAVGATLPGNKAIQATKLRGILSEGMLCSSVELGLAAQASKGLLVLPVDAPAGMDLRQYLQLDDMAIDLELTPNRGDCLSIAGLAREVSAATETPLAPIDIPSIPNTCKDVVEISNQAPGEAPRYCCRVIRNIRANAITPLWMQERLRRSGFKLISPVVDVTNYVMLELGQPLHAFDQAKLAGKIVIRFAKVGESLETLDGNTLTLDETALVIADEQKAHALAGVMGGLDSSVSETTQSIVLESAWFNPKRITRAVQKWGIHSDSSHRFERAIATDLQTKAIERATQLIIEIAGGEVGPIQEDQHVKHLPLSPTIQFRVARAQELIGVSIEASLCKSILERLGCEVRGDWQVKVPSHRSDLALEVDLIEEIARVYGYEKIPLAMPNVPLGSATSCVNHQRIKQLFCDRGYQEAVTYSFVDPNVLKKFETGHQPIVLANPISQEMSAMRTTLWAGLIQVVQNNQNRQYQRSRLFEIGKRFRTGEEIILAGVIEGSALPEQWGVKTQTADFFDAKADLEALLTATGKPSDFKFQTGVHPALHPGQSAQITYQNQPIGFLGLLHPYLQKQFDLKQGVVLFEIDLGWLASIPTSVFQSLSKFPTVRRDIAVIVDRAITADHLLQCCKEIVGEKLQDIVIFDVYQGKGIEVGKKSVALGLTLGELTHTLTDEEVASVMRRVVEELTNQYHAVLRDNSWQ